MHGHLERRGVALTTHLHLQAEVKEEYICASSPLLGLHDPFHGELHLILHPLTEGGKSKLHASLQFCSDLISHYVLSLAWGKTCNFLMVQNVAP